MSEPRLTVVLDEVEDAEYAECIICGAQLLVDPDKSHLLTHNDDGSHGYDPDDRAG